MVRTEFACDSSLSVPEESAHLDRASVRRSRRTGHQYVPLAIERLPCHSSGRCDLLARLQRASRRQRGLASHARAQDRRHSGPLAARQQPGRCGPMLSGPPSGCRRGRFVGGPANSEWLHLWRATARCRRNWRHLRVAKGAWRWLGQPAAGRLSARPGHPIQLRAGRARRKTSKSQSPIGSIRLSPTSRANSL